MKLRVERPVVAAVTLIAVVCAALAAREEDAGDAAYRAARYADALEWYRTQVEIDSDSASGALWFNLGLAALGAGELRDAEIAAEMAAVRGGDDFRERRDGLLGAASFRRCERAERQADRPEAEPFAYDLAIAHAQRALEHWRRQRMTADEVGRDDNVERALLKIRALQAKKAEKEQSRRKEPREPPPPAPDSPPPAGGESSEGEREVMPQWSVLRPEQVRTVLERLAQKDAEKRALRRRAQQSRPAAGEKDW